MSPCQHVNLSTSLCPHVKLSTCTFLQFYLSALWLERLKLKLFLSKQQMIRMTSSCKARAPMVLLPWCNSAVSLRMSLIPAGRNWSLVSLVLFRLLCTEDFTYSVNLWFQVFTSIFSSSSSGCHGSRAWLSALQQQGGQMDVLLYRRLWKSPEMWVRLRATRGKPSGTGSHYKSLSFRQSTCFYFGGLNLAVAVVESSQHSVWGLTDLPNTVYNISLFDLILWNIFSFLADINLPGTLLFSK